MTLSWMISERSLRIELKPSAEFLGGISWRIFLKVAYKIAETPGASRGANQH
jgi:hypothetical protein